MDEEKLSKGRVILPYSRSIIALVAAHSLGRKGVEVIGCDSVDFTVVSFSKYATDHFIYTDPYKDEKAFVDDMVEKVKEYKPEDDRPYVLMPVFDDIQIFARNRHRFPDYIHIAVPDPKAIDALYPKDSFAETVEKIGVEAPRTWMPSGEGELGNVSHELDYPVLIKPYDQTGGRGIHKVDDAQTLLEDWRENKEKYKQKSLVQEVVEGEDYCLTALYDHGKRRASMAYKNLHRFPLESGAGAMRETIDDSPFTAIADKLMGELEWNGVAEFDFMWNGEAETKPAMLEVNTRFWGGLFQSVESGIDFPWLLYKLTFLGEVECANEPKIGTKTKLPALWLFSAVNEIMNSDEETRARIEEKGKAAIDAFKQGQMLKGMQEGFDSVSAYLGSVLDFQSKGRKFKEAMAQGREARTEIFDADDPKSAFGVLFIIGSLLRHGHLPREVKF